ncbi:OmpA family protein [Morganella morganii]|uniref:OmpA family protein n=1 Tax=Morganella sp. GD04133 TaxID=2975435 RepID=UPI0024487F5A|nr:OmpA family protein [Morganella sp. GD04133]MDH0356086.1 OmpA family protein [Morganella sp. GD04133]
MKNFAAVKKWLIILFSLLVLTQAGLAVYDKAHLFIWLSGLCISLFIIAVISAVRIREHSEVVVQDDGETDRLTAPEIVFILGPYARTWFSRQDEDDTLRFDNRIIWMLINKPDDIHKQVTAIRQKHRHYQISAIFPILPDGNDSDILLLNKLQGWKNSFSRNQFEQEIPCTLIIYSRLSNQRLAHDPDNAIWVGKFNLYDTTSRPFRDEITALRKELNTVYLQSHAIASQHRNALALSTLNWLDEAGLMTEIESLFSESVLSFTNLMFSDYGNGPTRHGAWSRWIQKKFTLLPRISSYLTLPPLPVNTGEPPPQIRKQSAEMTPVPYQKVRYSLLLIPVLIAGAITGSLLWSLDFNIQRNAIVNRLVAEFDATAPNALQQRFTIIQQMKSLSDAISHHDKPYFFIIELTPSDIFISKLDKSITEFSRSPLYVAHDKNIVFDIGSSQLKEENTEYLMPVLTFIKQNPDITILIEGYTDNTGSDKTNINLSLNRAEQVRHWLQKSTGFPDSHFVTRGLGAQNPIADNDSQDGREQNRRVEIKIYQENQ